MCWQSAVLPRTPLSADRSVLAIISLSRIRCSAYLDAWHYNSAACNKVVGWSIVRSCGKYEQREREGIAEMAELNDGLQTRQEERYLIAIFLHILGGSFTSFS